MFRYSITFEFVVMTKYPSFLRSGPVVHLIFNYRFSVFCFVNTSQPSLF